jgi:DNA-binding transcriptional LysR family regulator
MAANITNLDLNLLLVLQVVLAERSATRAAERLHVTQSAVSNALTRLRALLDDPLVVRNARGLSPTPRALALQPTLDALIAAASLVLERPEAFDPATTTREFSVACADYYTAVVVPRLIDRLRARAPHATLRVRSLEELVTEHGLDRDVDVHIGIPPKMPSGCLSTVLFEDRFVCLVRPGMLKKGTRRVSLKAFLAASHVRISVLGRARDPVDTLLEARGVTRSVALVVPYFSVVPFVVHEAGLMATMSRRMAAAFAQRLPIDLLEPPLELNDYGVRMIWHRRTDADEGARFFRAVLQELMSES